MFCHFLQLLGFGKQPFIFVIQSTDVYRNGAQPALAWFPHLHLQIFPESLGWHPYAELLLISRSEVVGTRKWWYCFMHICVYQRAGLWEAGNLILCKTLYPFPEFISCHRTLLSFAFYILVGLYYHLFYVLMDNIYPYCFDVVVFIKSILLILWEICYHTDEIN